MTRQFTLPDLGEGLEEAEIVAWLVNEGDHVIANQPLVSVETDKAVVEIPSPWSGTIARLFGTKGDLVKVGSALVEFSEGAETDTGTIVGEVSGANQLGGSSRHQRRCVDCRCSLRFGPWRASSMSISTSCKAAGPAG